MWGPMGGPAPGASPEPGLVASGGSTAAGGLLGTWATGPCEQDSVSRSIWRRSILRLDGQSLGIGVQAYADSRCSSLPVGGVSQFPYHLEGNTIVYEGVPGAAPQRLVFQQSGPNQLMVNGVSYSRL